MFSLFKKSTEEEKLRKKYKKLMEESFKFASTDRKRSDLLRAEAEELMDQIEKGKEK